MKKLFSLIASIALFTTAAVVVAHVDPVVAGAAVTGIHAVAIAAVYFGFIELPADVDYITSYNFNGGQTKVPTLSTITVNLIPVYSRREMSSFGVDQFIKGGLDGKGFV